jgi:hypothetical protein
MNQNKLIILLLVIFILTLGMIHKYEVQLEQAHQCELRLGLCGESLAMAMNNFEELQTITEQVHESLNILDQITVSTNMDSGQFLDWFRMYSESFGFHACIQ